MLSGPLSKNCWRSMSVRTMTEQYELYRCRLCGWRVRDPKEHLLQIHPLYYHSEEKDTYIVEEELNIPEQAAE